MVTANLTPRMSHRRAASVLQSLRDNDLLLATHEATTDDADDALRHAVILLRVIAALEVPPDELEQALFDV